MASNNTSGAGIGWRNLRTGLLFLFGLVLAGLLGLLVGKNSGLFSRQSTVHIFVADIKGLAEGNMVSISGKKVGTITSMRFAVRNDTSGVLADLDIRSDYFALIPRDSRAIVKSLGVLGDKYIDIYLGHAPELVKEGDFLEVGKEPGFEELTASAIRTMTAIAEASEKINRGEGTIGKLISSSELSDRFMRAATNLEAITVRLSSGRGLAARVINDEQLGARVASIITNADSLSTSLAHGRGSLGKFLVDESFYTSVTSVTGRADSLLARVNDPRTSIGRLTRDDEFYLTLSRTIGSLDSLLQDLKENPGRYVRLSLF